MMNFFAVGSINNYIKTSDMRLNWQIKKKTNDFTPATEKERFQQQIAEEHNKKDTTLSSIHSKIEQGTELSAYEMNYLKDKEPLTYQKLKNLESEKKSYKKSLENCRTKEEVEKLKISKINASLSTIKNVENNPHIPESKKLEIAQEENRRVAEIEKITVKFINSEKFEKLPDETEIDKAEKILKKADKNSEKIEAENSEEVKKFEYVKNKYKETLKDDEESIINKEV